jgi:hypothetical protein
LLPDDFSKLFNQIVLVGIVLPQFTAVLSHPSKIIGRILVLDQKSYGSIGGIDIVLHR